MIDQLALLPMQPKIKEVLGSRDDFATFASASDR